MLKFRNENMRNVVNVKKLNVEILAAIKMLESNGMTYEEIMADDELKNHIMRKMGIDLSKVELKNSYELLLDIDKVLAVGPIEKIPGIDNMEGFAIWFDHDAKNCWYLDTSNYKEVVDAFQA